MQTTISRLAPIEERRKLIADAIATETLALHQRTKDFATTKRIMQNLYDDFVPDQDQTWMSEDFYCWLVEYAIHSSDVDRYGSVPS